jgi:DNA-binding GntR family transcriptional regulator
MMAKFEDESPLSRLLAALPHDEDRRKGKLHGNTVSVLRNLIVTGALAPGSKLNERELCERLNVSRTPVREALKTLTQEGLLRSHPNHSPVVTEMDMDEITSLIDVVASIESLAGRLAARRVTDEMVAELGLLHYQMFLHHTRDELPDYFEANKAFHRKIIEFSGNRIVLWIWDLLALRVDRARYHSNRWPARWQAAIQEHQGLLDALSAGDEECLAHRMEEHVRNGLSLVVESMRRRQAELQHGTVPAEESA